MTAKAIEKMLDLHSVTWYEDNGHIIGIRYYTTRNGRRYEDHTDLTANSRKALLSWLGYDEYGT